MTIAVHESGSSLPAKIEFAKTLAGSNLLPKAYQQQPANILLAMELGEALGIPAIQAINSIHVIEGKPSASADLIASLIRRAGHKLRVTVDDQKLVAVAQIIRADDKDFTYEARWDMEKAKAAGLAGKGVWRQYPSQMLRSRAVTEVARMGASDALYGVVYTPEELGGDEPKPTPQAAAPPRHTVTQVQSIADVVAEQEAVAEVWEEPPAEPEVPLRSEAQSRKLAVLMRELGMDNRDEALALYSDWISRPVESTKELTKPEASVIIDRLEALKASSADPVTGEVSEGGDPW